MLGTTEDCERVQELVGTLRGAAIREVEAALAENRDGVMRLAEQTARNPRLSNPPAAFVASVRKGEHKRRMRVVSTNDETTGTTRRARVPAADALRRLYDAKLDELTRYGVREPDRSRIAVDYACGEIHRCDIEPMPPGGLGALEDALYAKLGIDRVTGLRHPPLTA